MDMNFKVQNKNRPGYQEIEMVNIKAPLNQNEDIYAANILRSRLNN